MVKLVLKTQLSSPQVSLRRAQSSDLPLNAEQFPHTDEIYIYIYVITSPFV